MTCNSALRSYQRRLSRLTSQSRHSQPPNGARQVGPRKRDDPRILHNRRRHLAARGSFSSPLGRPPILCTAATGSHWQLAPGSGPAWLGSWGSGRRAGPGGESQSNLSDLSAPIVAVGSNGRTHIVGIWVEFLLIRGVWSYLAGLGRLATQCRPILPPKQVRQVGPRA